MPQQFIIKGNISLVESHEVLQGIVQAFDNDLPSLERPPQWLGESPIDANGGFSILYKKEQFSKGEADSRLFNRLKQKSADVSFQAFNQTGEELKIQKIEAVTLNRKYGPDQLIFNAPAALEVNIFVESPKIAGDSEFEQLVDLINPVIEELPLTKLTDEDVDFLIKEIGTEQKSDEQKRIEWLRRTALLTQETNLPIEAFYGWGREGIPQDFEKLSKTTLTKMPQILKELIAENDEKLVKGLKDAIHDKIIPAVFADRTKQIIRQLRRLNEVAREIVAQLLDADTEEELAAYAVTTLDLSREKENLGLDITDGGGRFSFRFLIPGNLTPGAPPRTFSFTGQTSEGKEFTESDPISIDLNNISNDIVKVTIKLSKPTIPTLLELQHELQLKVPSKFLSYLRDKEGITTLADIRHKGGIHQMKNLPAANPALIKKLESLADLDRLSPNLKMNVALIEKDFDSVLAIADTPRSLFVSEVKDAAGLNELEATKLHVMARAQTDFLNNMLVAMAADQANGYTLV